MTIKKLIEKYMKLQKQGYESILISQVISDLRPIIMANNLRRANRREGNEL
jgi:uncharacterized radical SAM superfamily protein